MRFITIYKPGFETDAAPTEQEMAAMGALIGEMSSQGVLLSADGLAGGGVSEIRQMHDVPAK
jgi:hypothetical protein